jgi:hypothetical protein
MSWHFWRPAAAGILLVTPGLASPAAAAWASPAGTHQAAAVFGGRLYGVAARSATDAWAAGLSTNGSLIVHWNGRSWSQSLSTDGFLTSVAAASPASAWAVGGTDWWAPDARIEHWNGKKWAPVRNPRLDPGGYFNAVAAISATNAWAVGLVGGGPGDGTNAFDHTLIEHWNGRTWTRVPSPSPLPGSGLDGIAAASATNAWAVGWTGTGPGTGGTSRTLIEHWNGRTWTRVPSPNLAPGIRTQLHAVAVSSPRDAWAVGTTHLDGNNQPFIAHWNGRTWSAVHGPTPPPGASLLGVAALSGRDAWAVGQTSDHGRCIPRCTTVIEHWNGRSWSAIASPNPPSDYLNALFGVVITAAGNAWAAGTTDYARTLILRWNGRSWS